jgi:hypothetical protein
MMLWCKKKQYPARKVNLKYKFSESLTLKVCVILFYSLLCVCILLKLVQPSYHVYDLSSTCLEQRSPMEQSFTQRIQQVIFSAIVSL